MEEKDIKAVTSRDGYIITLYSDNSSKVERLFIQRDTRKELEKIWLENSNGEPIPPTCSNTQSLGKKILDTFCNGERKGVIGDYEITREPNNSISLSVHTDKVMVCKDFVNVRHISDLKLTPNGITVNSHLTLSSLSRIWKRQITK